MDPRGTSICEIAIILVIAFWLWWRSFGPGGRREADRAKPRPEKPQTPAEREEELRRRMSLPSGWD